MKTPPRQSRKKSRSKGPVLPKDGELQALLAEHHFKPDDKELEALGAYLSSLVTWNRSINLVGHDDWREIVEDLFLDSLHLAGFLADLYPHEKAFPMTLDPGAGAGLPGIPLRIFWQSGTYLMVEPREKRCAFLHYALSRLHLPRTQALRARLEDVPAEQRPADLIISRAFMPWRELLGIAGEYLAAEGRVIVMASDAAPPEAAAQGPFVLERSLAYPAGEKERFFWSFTLLRP
jgi:16S rRNA (guanine527-N7)-methyltransferase